MDQVRISRWYKADQARQVAALRRLLAEPFVGRAECGTATGRGGDGICHSGAVAVRERETVEISETVTAHVG